MSEKEEARMEAFNQSNDGYSTASMVQFRLDTGPMLDGIEAFFRGQRITSWKEEDGAVKPVFSPIGKPKMNAEGVQSMMSWLTPLFSPHTVQGNKTEEEYVDYMVRLGFDLREMVMTNLHNWEIKIEDYNVICDMIMNTADMFFSRTIDNKERESYMQSLRTTERLSQDTGGGFFNNLKNPLSR